ncbi:MAG: hypothetical protein ABI462_04885 [Ignavibacteria bacterium]
MNKTSIVTIKKSLKAFTTGLIDYAGLFPPAKLKLEDACRNYLNYINGDHKFMLSKFICPVTLFSELEKLIPGTFPDTNDFHISAIGRSADNSNDFNKLFDDDIVSWKKFNSGVKEKIKVTSFEVKIPLEIVSTNDPKHIAIFLDNISSRIRNQISQPVMLFIEGSSGNNRKDNLRSLINGIEIHDQKIFDTGFKLRTGGTEAGAFPSPEHIAFSIRQCLDRKVPMKFTAGLHHPFPLYDKSIGVRMYGFINVFAAGIIAMRHNISDAGIEELLNDNNASNFIFTDEYFSWKDWNIGIADIEYARKALVLSFGSCSFDEPVDDLKALNLF